MKADYSGEGRSQSQNLKRAYMTIVIPSRKPVFVEETLTLPAGVVLLPGLSLMQQLHAYWRMAYIEAPRYPAVKKPFTELPALGDDCTALIVHRSRLSYLMLNRFPYNPGHLLAIPFREVVNLEDLNTAERADLMEIIIFGDRVLQAALKPDGINIGFNLGHTVSGGSIPHLHGHIVPRWDGDTNFMPVLAETRILPQALETTWEKLHAAAAQLSGKRKAESGKRKRSKSSPR
jgi:ATP adenylyltransferase